MASIVSLCHTVMLCIIGFVVIYIAETVNEILRRLKGEPEDERPRP